MSFAPVLVGAFVALSAAAFVAWAWLARALVEQQLRSMRDFEGMDIEI